MIFHDNEHDHAHDCHPSIICQERSDRSFPLLSLFRWCAMRMEASKGLGAY